VDWAKIANETRVNPRLFHLRHWNKRVPIHTWQETFNYLITLVQDEKIRLMRPESDYCLSDIQEAVRHVESQKGSQGKVMLTS
jgi:NADPH:quinone reductase-like Zn-dependent oxidoreductase